MIKVRHCAHTDMTYSLTLELGDRLTDMTWLPTQGVEVAIYTLTTDEMLELANAIMQQAFKIKERKEQDSVPRQA